MPTTLSKEHSTTPPESAPDTSLGEEACELALEILRASRQNETARDQRYGQQMADMLDDPAGKAFVIALSDEVLRYAKPTRGARRFRDLLLRFGVPGYLPLFDRTLLKLGAFASKFLPGIVMPRIAAQVRLESKDVILSAEPADLSAYLSERKNHATRVNINQLGEAVLGEGEAGRRMDAVLARLDDPAIDYISVKISAVFSQIHLTGYAATLEKIKERLRRLYRAAASHSPAKFVNLDMEEYRDLHLTVDAFTSILSEEEFLGLEAGIVLQAYLPDSFQALQDLTNWAKSRHAQCGSCIKVRLVKGANLAMETVEASIHGWEQAPYNTKRDVDANFKRMLHFACRPENADAVRIGVASHNLFDIAYALILREKNNVSGRVEFEMLEGMANAQAAVVQDRAGGLLVYAPIVQRAHFQSAIAYLVRRLEENTAPENFLRDLFSLSEGSNAWENQKASFLDACLHAQSPALSNRPNRTQNRLTESPAPVEPDAPFKNEADTDFSLPQNRQWLSEVVARWSQMRLDSGDLPGKGTDPSCPGKIAYHYPIGGSEEVEAALQTAVAARPSWERLGIAGRSAILRKAAAVIAKHRGETLGCMMLDGGKSAAEADAEISEAVDFANYYALSLTNEAWFDGTRPQALGTVLVTPPWNFPYAIPAGGCMAALMAGNSVILKPPPETVLTVQKVAEHLWEAGVPKNVLQLLIVPDNEIGKSLVTDDRIAAVILTGACETAEMFLDWKPGLRLSAETSGKNSLIITQAADVDLAIKDLVKGAFGHAGQKCSATSLAIVESAVYQDRNFRAQLKDAAESLHVGSVWDPNSVITPLIREPGPDLLRALTELDPGEEWLLEPRMIDGNPCLWSPGIRLGVHPGSWFHRTECFGPVLGIIRVNDLDHAIAVQNDNDFGLTGGIHSLDEKETARWRDQVEVGNAYINRSTTGAIVRRQPFGGWKKSVFGPGSKAGGPNYVASFCHWHSDQPPLHMTETSPDIRQLSWKLGKHLKAQDFEALQVSAGNYAWWWKKEFSIAHDPSRLHGESNRFRYRPHKKVIIRHNGSSDSESLLALAQIYLACHTCHASCEISSPAPLEAHPSAIIESAEALTARLSQNSGAIIRSAHPLPVDILRAANKAHIPVHTALVLANGRIELLHYLKEQAISETTHRYGNVIAG